MNSRFLPRTLPLALLASLAVTGCGNEASTRRSDDDRSSKASSHELVPRAVTMVREQLEARGIRDPAVLQAMQRVPRHRFVPESLQDEAYADHALPIGHEQTISQPYVVAFMTESLALEPTDEVLEIGTGSGYQAAVLAELVARVRTIEIVAPLAERAKAILAELGYDNVSVRTGDGYRGWPEEAPFDAILVTAAPDHVPQPLIDQLKVGGRMILPVGDDVQELILLEKTEEGVTRRSVLPVRFVPMTGEAERDR